MAGKRDLVSELKAYINRSRLAAATETDPDMERFKAILAALKAIDETGDEKLAEELRRHIVVSLAAVIQASTRRTIAEIVDGKEKRAEELPELPEVKITLAMVRELRKREFSLGQLSAHFFSPLGGFEQVSSALKRVSGEDLNTILLNLFRKEGHENPEESLADTRAHLVKLFYYRNIYCYEEGVGISVNGNELHYFFLATLHVIERITFHRTT